MSCQSICQNIGSPPSSFDLYRHSRYNEGTFPISKAWHWVTTTLAITYALEPLELTSWTYMTSKTKGNPRNTSVMLANFLFFYFSRSAQEPSGRFQQSCFAKFFSAACSLLSNFMAKGHRKSSGVPFKGRRGQSKSVRVPTYYRGAMKKLFFFFPLPNLLGWVCL